MTVGLLGGAGLDELFGGNHHLGEREGLAAMCAEQNGKVVVGFDGLDNSRETVRWAAFEAVSRNQELLVVRAIPAPLEQLTRIRLPTESVEFEPLRTECENEVNTMVSECGEELPELRVDTVMKLGHPAKIIGEVADRADLLVLGPPEQSQPWRMLLGSTSAELVRTARPPVVVVRGERERERIAADPRRFTRVVVGVDGSRGSERAIGFAYEFASRHQAELVALLSWNEVRKYTTSPTARRKLDWEQVRETCERVLSESVVEWKEQYPDVSLHSEVVTTEGAADALFSASEQADLLVVGSQGRGPIRSSLLGSVSHAVAHYARCPVAVVR
ncbi:nucleotide-binding universal stress UspA family protein [Actinopolyspora biskrensis]|uniref:Nucleotide-binding universal stress UspA family protein n=1 Tax=Actinopolyspora biskrensis TaxID=1470178 RepID=A0A852YWB9_9ACTN|nr:universal stress protein [Actinopolyspora biskrensis]NYH78358.1 nucleotide-binding universal stress UspA family protein [Actinopolyspora biskrensis]